MWKAGVLGGGGGGDAGVSLMNSYEQKAYICSSKKCTPVF